MKYDGSLHEKTVRKFINIISYESNPLLVKFLIKQLRFMVNLPRLHENKIDSYWDNASFKVSVQPEDEVHNTDDRD